MKVNVYDKKTKELIQTVEGIQRNSEVFIRTLKNFKNKAIKEKYNKK